MGLFVRTGTRTRGGNNVPSLLTLTMLYPPLVSGLTRQSRHGQSIDWLLEVDRGDLILVEVGNAAGSCPSRFDY